MTKPSNLESIEKGTGRKWDDWAELLETAGARDMTHTEIAEFVRNEYGVDGWWAQGITVAYEQHIGRRVPGQVADGTFEVASSRTLGGMKADIMSQFADMFDEVTELNDVKVESNRTSGTDIRLYWKANLADGSRTIVAAEDKPGAKTLLTATQVKVESAEKAQSWKDYWKDQLAAL